MTRISEILNNLLFNTNKPAEIKDTSVQPQIFDFDAGNPMDTVEFTASETSAVQTTKKLPDEITVQKGDTIESLAAILKITPKEFKDTYGVTSIKSGDVLKKKTKTSTTNNNGYTEYKVKSGETLGGIANRNNTTVDAIMKLNGLKSADDVKADQVLKIPSGASTSANTTKTKSSTTNNNGYTEYKVKSGETLGGIANRNNTTVEAIMKLNGLKSADDIKADQVLKIPSGASTTCSSQTQATQTSTTKDMAGFLYALRMQESTDNYSAKNRRGYIGAYQFGERALADLGIYSESGSDPYSKNDWAGYIKKNKYGITSISGFLSSKKTTR